METVSSTLVLTGSADNTARLWDCELGKCLRTFESKSAIRTCCFSMLTGQLMYSTDTTMGQLCELLLYEKGDSLCVAVQMLPSVLHKWSCGPAWHQLNIRRNLSIEDTTEPQLAVLYTVEPLYRGHHWDPAGCPVYSGTSL